MSKPHNLSLHIFRRDLRLQDNTALIEALKSSRAVLPCFIFDPRQIENNDYKNDNAIQFMVNSLKALDTELQKKDARLYFFKGITEEVITNLFIQIKIDAVFVNRDYTPFSITRDHKIKEICQKHHIHFYSYADALLNEPEQITKINQQPYTVFTHFLNKAKQLPIQLPRKNNFVNYYHHDLTFEDEQTLSTLLQKNNLNLTVKGGRTEALSLLKKINQLTNYHHIRNFPAIVGTTKLSAHNKFGTLSIREFYHAIAKHLGVKHTLITELYWRDFFTHIAFHFPKVFNEAFHEKYKSLPWSKNEKNFRHWCEGRTGFPIIDAGMRELNTTGYMHNRVRMIVASFLIKDLQIDWRRGEKYFAQKLVDYDPAVNNGNWQWVASTGCDAQPYFRIFNPWLQQKKFDPECLYIKRWIPELACLSPKIIHSLYKQPHGLKINYPDPMINHAIQAVKAKRMYRL